LTIFKKKNAVLAGLRRVFLTGPPVRPNIVKYQSQKCKFIFLAFHKITKLEMIQGFLLVLVNIF